MIETYWLKLKFLGPKKNNVHSLEWTPFFSSQFYVSTVSFADHLELQKKKKIGSEFLQTKKQV